MKLFWLLIALLFVASNVQAEIRGSGFPSGLPNTGSGGGAGTASSNSKMIITVATSTSRGKAAADYTVAATSAQTTINTALVLASATNGTVKLLEGQYNISGPILIPSNVVFDFSGAIIFLSNSSNTPMIENFNFPNADSNITIIGGKLDGNGANQGVNTISLTAGYHSIWLKNVTNFLIKDVWINEPANYAISPQLDTYGKISNIHCTGSGVHLNQACVQITDSTNIVVNGLTGYTADDFFAVDAETVNTENISFSNVSVDSGFAGLKLINNYYLSNSNVFLQNSSFTNLTLKSSVVGLVRVTNYAASNANIRNITINGLVGKTTSLGTVTDTAAFSFRTAGTTTVGMQNLSVSGCDIIDDGSGKIIDNSTSSEINFSNCNFSGFITGVIPNGTTNISKNNVGIGTISPASFLQVSGAVSVANNSFLHLQNTSTASNDQTRLQLTRGIDTGTGVSKGFVLFQGDGESGQANYEAGNLTFFTGTSVGSISRRMVVSPAGNVGISTTAPGALLSLGTNVQTPVIYVYDGALTTAKYGLGIGSGQLQIYAGNSAGNKVSLGNFDGTTFTEKFQVNNAGNVGIGTLTPGQVLDVTGNIRNSGVILNTGITSDAGKTDATVCEDTTNHQFYSGSGTIGICLGTSTVNAKQNITPINEGISQIMELKPISFNYREGWGFDSKKPYYGFLAEDMAPIFPNLVGRNNKGEIRNADYVGLIPVMVKSIQQLQNEVNDLKNKKEE